VDWGIGWQSDLAPHKHSTSVHPVMVFEQLDSSEHSDSQQQRSGNCWSAKSLNVVEWKILVQLSAAMAEMRLSRMEHRSN
jgi:aminopeptidase C